MRGGRTGFRCPSIGLVHLSICRRSSVSVAWTQPSLAIHSMWKPETDAVMAVLPEIEAKLAPEFDTKGKFRNRFIRDHVDWRQFGIPFNPSHRLSEWYSYRK